MKIENRLYSSDFAKIEDSFRMGSVDAIELLPAIDLGFVTVSPMVVSGTDKEYTLSTRIAFDDPIGNTVCFNIGIKEQGIKKNSKQIDFALARPLGDKEELGRSITYGLSLVEKVVNYACEFRFEDMFENFVVDSRVIEKQIEKKKKEKERESRHEKLEPFAIIHADAGYDLRAQSDDLVPIYWEYDKYDLYGGKKAYCMLPKDFAAAVLKCDLSALISEEQFGKTERKILDELVNRKCLKKRQIAGKTYYFDLDGKTRTYLIKALRTRT